MSPLFLVRLTDRPEGSAIRSRYLEAHKAWLGANGEQVRAAGLLRHEEQGAPFGACWIVAAASRGDVERLVREDPFWAQGLRASCEILHWSRGFPPQPVTI